MIFGFKVLRLISEPRYSEECGLNDNIEVSLTMAS